MLLDNHVQYRLVLDDSLTPGTLATTRVLVIPNAACMAETTMDVIRGFVRAGGQALATYETSMYTPSGMNRGDFGLSDVFGCAFTGIRQDASFCGYQYVNGRHPITESFADTEVIANRSESLLVQLTDDASARMPFTFVPKIAPQLPERSWLPSLRTDFPTLVEHDYHEGRAILLPNRSDQNVWRKSHPDFSVVLINSVRHLPAGPLSSSAPGLIRVMVSRAMEPGPYLTHLVNVAGSSRRPLTHPAVLKDIELVVGLDARSIGELTVLHGDMAISAVASPKSSGLRIHLLQLAVGVATCRA